MATLRQTSFSAGELDPRLWGRTDLEIFGKGLRTCRNFLVTHQGALQSRPGTMYLGETKGAGFSKATRLLPFVFSREDAYVLEFGHLYVRFWRVSGSQVVSGATPYEVATPWTESDLAKLQWVQSGDVLTLTHPTRAPQELRRYGETDWRLSALTYAPLEPYFRDTAAPYTATKGFEVVSPLPVADGTHPAREWKWQTTVVAQHMTTGETFETLPETVERYHAAGTPDTTTPLPTLIAVYPDRPVTLERATTAGLLPQPAGWDEYRPIAFNVYRGRGDLFGFVGQTKTRTFVDTGQEPDYEIQPPRGTHPFRITSLAGVVTEEYPAAVTYHEERRVFAGTAKRPGTLWLSATGDYGNFDERAVGVVATQALWYELASRRRETIRSLLSAGPGLLAFGDASVWHLSGGEQGGLDATKVPVIRRVDAVGASYLPALEARGAVLYVTTGGAVRALIPSGSGFEARPLSQLAEHLIPRGAATPIVDWTYAEEPQGVVWLVRNDGVLLSLTFEAGDAVRVGWAQHETDGDVTSVCAVPSGAQDVVFLVVARTVNGTVRRYVERMEAVPDIGQAALTLDSARSYTDVARTTLTDLAHLEDEDVWLVAGSSLVAGPLRVIGGAVALPAPLDPSVTTYAGLLYHCELETLDVAQGDARTRPKNVLRVGFEVSSSAGVLVGPDLTPANLTPWRQRTAAMGYLPLTAASDVVTLSIRGGWNVYGRAALRTALPLPVTVLGLTRELDVGG